MKSIYSQFTEDELWLVKETGWARELQNIRESQFALGNGYMGSRGVHEELPYDAKPGTYISGLYDKIGSQVTELVNLPNPVNFRISIEGEKLGLVAMDTVSHNRTLNMKNGLLVRQTVYRDVKKRRYNYESLRFISMHNKNIGVMQITVTPLDSDCTMEIHTGMDTSVYNTGVLSEGRKRHFRIKELGQAHNAGYLVIDTLQKKHTVIYWSGFYYETGGKKTFARENIFSLKLKKNKSVTFTKVFCIKHFPFKADSYAYKKQAFQIFYKAFHGNFNTLLKNHSRAWERLWKKADIVIKGTTNLQINLRFNIYHMLISAHSDNGFSSIGARTLSGEGYHGHIFWDAEIFLMPFFLFNFPEIARNMLIYRHRRLNKARELARSEGYKGAKFAWESADTGEEETPEWARDFDGTVIKIHTHKMEHHITSDIAYAVYKYYQVTHDKRFMECCGYELIFETARFWASRAGLNKRNSRYEIKDIIGPDEFHIGVNNNAYTNILAGWNLNTASAMYKEIKKNKPVCVDLTKKLNIRVKEAWQWNRIASLLKVNTTRKGIIEQFDGYLKLKNIPLTRFDENGIPEMPPRLRARDMGKTQFVKQADVLMLFYLLEDEFNPETILSNYEFYINRTLHKSSLSPSMHAVTACRTGDMARAHNLFNVSLHTDISNLFGNTPEGIHAASLGGTWQAVIFGFSGVSIKRNTLFINPRMPHYWKGIVFSLTWRGDIIKLELTNDTITLRIASPKKREVEIGIFDKPAVIRTNRRYLFKRKMPLYKEYYHY